MYAISQSDLLTFKIKVELGESITARTESLCMCRVGVHKSIADAWP